MGSDKNQRGHFRLEYPPGDRPKLTLALVKGDLEVLDLSERGVKFAIPTTLKMQADAPIKGTIKFRDGKVCEVEGKVIRVSPDGTRVAAHLTKGVPLAKMMEEQRYILQKYQK